MNKKEFLLIHSKWVQEIKGKKTTLPFPDWLDTQLPPHQDSLKGEQTEQELELHGILELFGVEQITHEQAHKDIFKLFSKSEKLSKENIQEIWKAACEAQMKEVYENILPGQNTNANAIKHWTKTPAIPKEFLSQLLAPKTPAPTDIKVGDTVEVYVPMFGKCGTHEVMGIENGYALFDNSTGKIKLEYCTKK